MSMGFGDPKIIAGIAFAIVLVAVIVWLVTRSNSDKNEEVDTSTKPEIEIINMSKTITPINVEVNETIENYTIGELVKNIDFTINWNNKGGVESISTLIFKRFNSDGTKIYEDTISRTTNDPKFKPYSKNNSYTFDGDTISDAMGKNTLKIFYILEGDTVETELFNSDEYFTGNNELVITQEDLKIVEFGSSVKNFTYTPRVGTFSISKMSPDKKYYLYPGGTYSLYDLVSLLTGTTSGTGNITFIPAKDDGSDNYSSKFFHIYLSGSRQYIGSRIKCPPGWVNVGEKCRHNHCEWPYFNADSDRCDRRDFSANMTYQHELILVSNISAAKKFELIESPIDGKYRIREVSSGRFMAVVSDLPVVINIDDDRITSEMYETIDFEIVEQAKSGECVYEEKWTPCGPPDVKWKYHSYDIKKRTANCPTQPKPPERCPADAKCTFNTSPCPMTCGGSDSNDAFEILNNIVELEKAYGTGKTCVQQRDDKGFRSFTDSTGHTGYRAPCARRYCRIGRTCRAKPQGGWIVRREDCEGTGSFHQQGDCNFIETGGGNVECEGTYVKQCAEGVKADDPGCVLQKEFTYTGDWGDDAVATIADLLGDVNVLSVGAEY